MSRKITIGSRGSKLALLYAQNAKDKIIQNSSLEDGDVIIKGITTKGDQVQEKRLSELGGKGLFSTQIEKELQEKKIDIAVHALKDMPIIKTDDLNSDFFLERNDAREILIAKQKKKFKELRTKSIIGTSSYRREFQIKKMRPDLECRLIRGNVDTRIKKLNEGSYDAIVLAYAGIKYLKKENEIAEIFSTKDVIPSAGQGIIALQSRKDDDEIISILNKVNHKETFLRANAERSVLRILEGDCETAVGAYAFIEKDKVILEAELFSLDGKQRFYEKKSSKIENAKSLGEKVGKMLKVNSNNSYKK